ncbi:MAG: hypothetical protein GY931_19005 [Maribacter sp.]|nr:hypothetical protein [Maribacter sp.]
MRYLILLLTFFQFGYAQDVPMAKISNGQIRAEIYLPDIEKGYYQGTRFDWSGVMPVLEYEGHSYFGKWFKNYNPKVHESVMGPVEEFAPIGYKEVEVGETFMKIGVGRLIKPQEPKYSKFKTYEIHDAGEWGVIKSSNGITFKHTLVKGDYPYEYEKIISLSKGKPEMVLEHTFTNTGNKTIETETYNHNFFFIDTMNIGPGYTVKFPFNLSEKGEIKGIGEFAEINGNKIIYIKDLGEKDNVYIGSLTGNQTNKNAYDYRIENKTSGAGVRITCDRPLSRLVFWSAQKTVCPEPYINIKVAPGKTFTWKITYNFYTL